MTSTQKISSTCLEYNYIPSYNNVLDTESTLKKDQKKSSNVINGIATALIATTLFLGSSAKNENLKKSFPTSYLSIKNNNVFNDFEDGKFNFENKEEVLNFIADKEDVKNLCKNLPSLIESVFGKVQMSLSVFKDYEENWSNLRVEIESEHDINALSALEDKLFKLLEKDKSFLDALDYVTICRG